MNDKRALVASALEYCGGTHNLEDIAIAVRMGEMQVFESDKAVIVTEVLTYPRLKALHAFLVAGDMTELLEILQPQIEAFAREQGCSRLSCAGRFGWTRVLPNHGWKNDCAVLTKELTHG